MKTLLLVLLSLPLVAMADPGFRMLGSSVETKTAIETSQVESLVRQSLDVSPYWQIDVRQMTGNNGAVDHLVLLMHVTGIHRLKVAALFLNAQGAVVRVVNHYHMSAKDKSGFPGSTVSAICPDTTIQFIAFAPNNDSTELTVTEAVAAAAQKAGLKVIQLLTTDATTQAYFNYMACPNVKGNFYDGDANPDEFVTSDGTISSTDMATFNFHLNMVNIWVACEAYNNPMLSTLITTAQSQKYAAGINDLDIGPSDEAAECGMIAAVGGSAMTAAFQSCIQQDDNKTDKWGFGGSGADLFGQATTVPPTTN